MTASNGDQVYGYFAGAYSPTGAVQLNYQTVGGTGRFAGAAGSGTMTGLSDGNNFTVAF